MTAVSMPDPDEVRRRASARGFPSNEAIPVVQSTETGEWSVGTLVISVIGLDLASPGHDPLGDLRPAARDRIAGAGLVVGGRWHLDVVAPLLRADCRCLVLEGDLGALDALAAHGGGVVLASGDPGLFGVLRALRERVGADRRVDVEPAVSSVAAVCAAAGTTWDDAVVVSAHGRDPRTAIAVCRRHPKVVVLTAPGFGPAEIMEGLGAVRRLLYVAEGLGGAGSGRQTQFDTARGLRGATFTDPNVVLVTDPDVAASGKPVIGGGRSAPDSWGLDEDQFDHRDGMVTKAEVRALAVAWLGPRVGDLVWDVGAGSGSVAVECSRLGAAAIAVERDAEQCARITTNAARHGAPVEVVRGVAPRALTTLPDPDAVFVGGGGTALPAVIRACGARGPRAVVVALAAVQRVAPVTQALEAAGLTAQGTLLSAARLAPLGAPRGSGGSMRLAAANPVFLLRGTRP